MRLPVLAAAAASAALLAGVGSANAMFSPNALTANALAPTGSQLDELNGVVVETVALPSEPAR